MFLADDFTSPLVVGGGALGILGFVVAIAKIWSSDRVWRSLISEVRSELVECRESRRQQTEAHAKDRESWTGERRLLEERVQTLTGEVISLRRLVHADMWTGTTPEAVRSRLMDQLQQPRTEKDP